VIRESKLSLADFVEHDRFDLNTYLKCLVNKVQDELENSWGKQKPIKKQVRS
jgi:hypothetical protein